MAQKLSNEIDVYTFRSQLIGQREGLQHALDLLKIQEKSLQNSINNKVQINKTKMVELITKLDSLSPLKTLTRGYSILEKDNKIVKSVKSLNINDEISIRLIDGNAKAKVIDIKE